MKKYLVGGAVRNILLNLPIKEKDWLIIGVTPQEMLDMGYQQVGKDFPVFLHPINHEEYALARIEKKTGKGYTGFTCHTSPYITIEQDLYRRDLTINSMAYDVKGKLIDPYNGQQDIQRKLLRHVSPFFKEDPLRILRTARFAAQLSNLHFTIAEDTFNIMKQMINELKTLSPERIWLETQKALSTTQPHIYFEILKNCGALKLLFTEIEELFGMLSSRKWHINIDIGQHTMKALSIVSNLTNNISIKFAMLCHDLEQKQNKTNTQNNYFSNTINAKLIEKLCKRLTIPKQLCLLAKIIAKHHGIIHNINNVKINKIIKLFDQIDVWRHPERIEQLILAGETDYKEIVKHNNEPYTQGEFLRHAYYAVQKIDLTKIISKKLTGLEIKKKIHKKRQQLLYIWKKYYNIYAKQHYYITHKKHTS